MPKQDATTYLGALLANRAAQPATWAFVQANWPLVREKTAAPMLTRRLIGALGELFERRAEIEALLDAQSASLASAPQAIKQTKERMRLDEETRRRALPELSAWVKGRAG